VGSRDPTDANSTLGGTATPAAGGADALAFGGLNAAVGDAGNGIKFKQLASGESRNLNYCSNILLVITGTFFFCLPIVISLHGDSQSASRSLLS
jgi:hypothetical protein